MTKTLMYAASMLLGAALIITVLGNEKKQLNEPLFSKFILSPDKTKILPILIDRPAQGKRIYNILITDKSCNGKLIKPYKPGVRVEYDKRIVRSVKFSPILLSSLVSKEATSQVEIYVTLECNKERIRNQRDDSKKDLEYTDDDLVIDRCYADIHMEMRNDSGTWEYDIHRTFSNGYHASTAPVFDIGVTPEVNLLLFKLRDQETRYGVGTKLTYCPFVLSGSVTNAVRMPYYPNWFKCKHAGQEMEAVITVKNMKGEVVQTNTRPLSKLSYKSELTSAARRRRDKFYRKNPQQFFKYNQDDYKSEYDYMIDKPEGGGTVEIEIDAGPMFGVIKASRKL